MPENPQPVRDASPLRRAGPWEDFFELMKTLDLPDDFLADRQDAPPQKRKGLGD
jgi:hypothetical protein